MNGSLPYKFRRPRLLLVGCGDVGLRVLRALPKHFRVLATTTQVQRMSSLRSLGATPLLVDLDQSRDWRLTRLGALATQVLHLAPPPASGSVDSRTKNLVHSLRLGRRVKNLVYASTTGVYGHCDGEWVDETRTINPQTDRARRRVDAENQLRKYGAQSGVRVNALRIPGIYASDRAGGDRLERIRQGLPVLNRDDDMYTNHIHADALAKACIAALWRGKPQRIYNVCEDCDMLMGDYYDQLADDASLPRLPRISRAQMLQSLSPMRMSFLSESRRLKNTRMKRELREVAQQNCTAL